MSPPLHRLPTLVAVAAFAAVLSTTLGACCEWAPSACQEAAIDDGGPPPAPDAGVVYATDGCSVDDITDQNGSVCATCGDAQICGAAEVARCESRENATGATCRFCATPNGEILYDSCNPDGTDTKDLHCEPSPNDPGSGLVQGDVQCQTCTDAAGNVVNTICEPAHDECHDAVDQNGLSCRDCTQAGVVVIHDCEQPDLSPRSCEVYGNETGRCVDCYDDNDQILSHSCTLLGNQLVTCSESVTPDGLRCSQCVDELGALVSSSCDTQVPELQQCAELDYTDQTCIVCVDQFDNPAVVNCSLNNCDANTDPTGACVPADCQFTAGQNGELCRTCPGPNGDEQRCVVDTNLVCENVITADANSTCLSCSDLNTGVEVYRRCDGQGSPPPVCGERANTTGDACEVCTDPQTQQDIYATCAGETCFARGQFQITGVQGNELFVDNAPAVSTCVQCGTAADSALSATLNGACSLRNDCPTVDLTDPQPFCSSTVVFAVLPRQCGTNPWETAGFSSPDGTTGGGGGGVDELNRILAYALATQSVALVALDDVGVQNNNGQCTGARGDTIEVAVRPEDAAKMSTLFGDTLERCAADSDCRTGGACRADGACTVAP